MRRTSLVIVRKVSLVVFSVMVLYWLVVFGGLIFLWATEGRALAIHFLRDGERDAHGGAWDPMRFAMRQTTRLLITVVSGVVAVRARQRIESL